MKQNGLKCNGMIKSNLLVKPLRNNSLVNVISFSTTLQNDEHQSDQIDYCVIGRM